MAYSANGLEFTDKNISRVKYDLIVDGNTLEFKGKAPEMIKVQLSAGATDIFFDSSDDYNTVAFNPTLLGYNYGDQIFLDVAGQKNFTWLNQAVSGDCLVKMNNFVNAP